MTLLACGASIAQAMSVEEAYQAIPHHRTVFSPKEATMPKPEADALMTLFEATDVAIIAKARVKKGESVAAAYADAFKAQKALRLPEKLKAIQHLIAEAVQNEHDYLSASRANPSLPFQGHPLVQSASQKLHQAYSELMRLYPSENASNKQAFFDYLCALDFV